ncbi:unnamed protein product [Pedinophyceae sp. YPF-701]|nr:unnamed protein product [Pedinophyceae sp. YPF-701]
MTPEDQAMADAGPGANGASPGPGGEQAAGKEGGKAEDAAHADDRGRSKSEDGRGDARGDKDEGRRGDRRDGRRSRERSRDRGGSRSDRRRSRDRERDRDRGRDRDSRRRSRDRSRGRDRSPSRRHRGRSRSPRDRRYSRDRHGSAHRHHRRNTPEVRDRYAPRSPVRPRRRTPPAPISEAEAAEKARVAELERLQREACTINIFNLAVRADERDVWQFFCQAGTVKDVRIIRDKSSGRSKGVAYVELASQQECQRALMLNGYPICGQPVMIKPSEAEKNLQWELEQQAKAGLLPPGMEALLTPAEPEKAAPTAPAAPKVNAIKLYVGNVHPACGAEEVRALFSPFGDVVEVEIQKMTEKANAALVTYRYEPDGKRAHVQLQNFELLERRLSIRIYGVLPPIPPPEQQAGAVAAGAVAQPAAGPPAQGGAEESLAQEEGARGGLPLSTDRKTALMHTLAERAGISHLIPEAGAQGTATVTVPARVPAGGDAMALEQGVLGPASPIPTPCLLLKNLFDPAEEEGDEWDVEIAEDVKDRCQHEFGPVLHHWLDRQSKGFMYLKFGDVGQAKRCKETLQGTFFNRRTIYAEYCFAQVYNQHFAA